MTLAVSTSPANAISNLSDFIEEVRDELDDDGFPLTKIYRAIGRAEARFNRDLRVARMETAIAFNVTDEITELPLDFLEMRHVYREGSPDNPMRPMSPAGLRAQYRGRSGAPQAFAIENRQLQIAPVGSALLKLTYYQRIPALTIDNPQNWLLDAYPDLYLHQVLAILYNKLRDDAAAAMNLTIANDMIESANRAAFGAHWGAGPLVPSLVMQVRGARA